MIQNILKIKPPQLLLSNSQSSALFRKMQNYFLCIHVYIFFVSVSIIFIYISKHTHIILSFLQVPNQKLKFNTLKFEYNVFPTQFRIPYLKVDSWSYHMLQLNQALKSQLCLILLVYIHIHQIILVFQNDPHFFSLLFVRYQS